MLLAALLISNAGLNTSVWMLAAAGFQAGGLFQAGSHA